jgi:hypothetical protein
MSFVPNDAVNLVVGLPALLGSVWLARRGRLSGLLLWPGALLYVLYNYLAYVFGLPFSILFLPHLALVALSAYTVVGLVAAIERREVQRRLSGVVPERLAGGVLVGLGALSLLRVVAVVVAALGSRSTPPVTEAAVLASDLVISPAYVVGGLLLWQRKPLGYVAGLGLLFQASTLFIGLAAFLLLQPLLTGAPLKAGDVLVVLAMGAVSFVPFSLFLRGAAASSHRPPRVCALDG